MALPVNPRDLMRVGERLSAERDKDVRLAIAVELDAPDALLAALEDALRPRTARTAAEVGIVSDGGPRLTKDTDVVIGVLGAGGPFMRDYLRQARSLGIHVVTLRLSGAGTATAGGVGQPLDDFLSRDDADALVRDDLGRWLADQLPEKRLALAAGFEFMRAAVSNEFVKSTAWQNALIGGVVIIPGADMPLMTGNQAKMVLQIAAAYGQKLDTARAKELLVVVGGGFAFRAIARELLDFVPGFGWALKAVVGYTGTIAVGKAAIAYFEAGADVGAVVRGLEAGTSEVLGRARDAVGRGEPHGLAPEPGAPYKLEASGADVAGD